MWSAVVHSRRSCGRGFLLGKLIAVRSSEPGSPGVPRPLMTNPPCSWCGSPRGRRSPSSVRTSECLRHRLALRHRGGAGAGPARGPILEQAVAAAGEAPLGAAASSSPGTTAGRRGRCRPGQAPRRSRAALRHPEAPTGAGRAAHSAPLMHRGWRPASAEALDGVARDVERGDKADRREAPGCYGRDLGRLCPTRGFTSVSGQAPHVRCVPIGAVQATSWRSLHGENLSRRR